MRILFGAVILGALAVLGFIGAQQESHATIARTLKSVEVGIAELSPRGLMGGIAVPASGESVLLPQANIFVRSEGGSWTGNNITIYFGEDIDIRWTSSNATQCTGSSAFQTGGAVSGIDTSVTAPASGATVTYTVTCTNTAGSATDSLTVTSHTTPPPECNDGVDNDDPEDTFIDFDGGGSALPATYNFTTQHPDSSYQPHSPNAATLARWGQGDNIKGTVNSLEGYNVGTGAWLFYSDQSTANHICAVAGYGSATINPNPYPTSYTAIHNPQDHRMITYEPVYSGVYSWGSPEDNTVVKWNGSTWQTLNAVGRNTLIGGLTCSAPPPATQPDPGCTDADDDDETDGPPTVELTVKNDNTSMSWTSDDITIPVGNNISLQWESSNATQCTGTAFSISPASKTSGTQSSVTEPTVGSPITYRVSCTRAGQPTATDFLTVTATAVAQPPTIDADPRIVRMGESTTLTWDTGSSDPAECSLQGLGLTSTSFVLTSEGSRQVIIRNESLFTLSCPAGTASVRVKVLPVIQES